MSIRSQRFFAIVVVALVGLTSLSASLPARAQIAFNITAPAGILVDASTGQVLWAKRADDKYPPASITKVMALLLVMEALDSKKISTKDVVAASRRASTFGGSSIWIKEGEQFTVDDLLKAVAVASANDASVVLSEYLAGSEEGFVDAMNKRVGELGLKNTHFYNSMGLPPDPGQPGNYSTPAEIAAMSRELLRHPNILKYTSLQKWVARGGKNVLLNTNHLLERYPGADGLKTGHTDEAGWSLVGTAQRNGVRLIAVVLHAQSDVERVQQAANLLDYGFRSYTLIPVLKKGERVGLLDVAGGGRSVVAVASADLRVLAARGTKPEVHAVFTPNKNLKAPVLAGRTVGTITAVSSTGQKFGTVPAVALETVKKANFIVAFFHWLWRGFVHLITFGRR